MKVKSVVYDFRNPVKLEFDVACGRGSITVQSAQRQFSILLTFVVIICLAIELFSTPPLPKPNPVPVYPRLYLTSECGFHRRLGNAMFAYASMLGIAERNNMTPVIARETMLTDVFNLDILISNDMANTGTFIDYLEYGHRGGAYDRNTKNLFKKSTPSHIFLRGYYQSWHYFDNVEEAVRKNFIFKDSILEQADKFLSSVVPPDWMKNGNFVQVGVHVRRGDMVTGYYREYGYTTASAEYFVRAMMLYVKRYDRVQFIVCSDDIVWCQSNIPVASTLGENVNVVFSIGHSHYVDLAILARCTDVIISVGSFGWWAAWLANGTTVYYDNWPRPFTMLEYHYNKPEYFPHHWIPMT